MRFPRHAKVFRGQIDAAPAASIFFLLVIFVFLNFSLVFTPGVRIQLETEKPVMAPRIMVARNGTNGVVTYKGETLKGKAFENRLREEARAGKAPPSLIYEVEPGVPPEFMQRIKNVAVETGVSLRRPGLSMELPDNAGFPGDPGPAVVIGINLNGQLFYQHQRIQPVDLQTRLAEAVKKSPIPLKIVLQADKEVQLQTIMEVSGICREAGASEVIIAHKPNLAPTPKKK